MSTTRREFLTASTILASLAGLTALQLRFPDQREILENLNTLTLEEANTLYPQVGFAFTPIIPTINHQIYKQALDEFLPKLPETNSLVYKFSEILDLGQSQLYYKLKLYDVDYTQNRKDLLPFVQDRVICDFKPSSDPRDVLARTTTTTFIQFLSGFEIIKKYGSRSKLFNQHITQAEIWANQNGLIFDFNDFPPSLAIWA